MRCRALCLTIAVCLFSGLSGPIHASPPSPVSPPNAALLMAAAKADPGGVKAALKSGADPAVADAEGCPALFLAGLKGRLRDTVPSYEEAQSRLDVMKLLLRKGAPVPAERGPLAFWGGLARQTVSDATYFRRYDVAELLLARGAPKDALNFWSVIRAWPMKENTRKRRALFDRVLAASDAPTRTAALFEAVTSDDASFFMARLLDRGADVNRRNWDGHTLLTQAVAAKRPDMVRLLLRHGADPRLPYVLPKSDYLLARSTKWDGKTPLMMAEAMGDERIAGLLKGR